jgi:type II secretion system protein G
MRRVRGNRGFTLIELLIVIAILGILAAISFALYVNVQARGRIGRATADVRTLTGAVGAFAAHMGAIPTTSEGLAVLAQPATNSKGDAAGPFLNVVPPPPGGGGPARRARRPAPKRALIWLGIGHASVGVVFSVGRESSFRGCRARPASLP